MDEVSLVQASQKGNRSAFGSLVDRYYQSIYRLAYHFTGNHHDADDVCQETFVRALDNIESLKDGSRFNGWVFMIASNLVRRHIKKKKLTSRTSGLIPPEDAEREHSQPFERLSSSEKAVEIQKRLQEMPEHMRLVTILTIMEGLSQKEAANVLDFSEASVSRYLEAAKKWLHTRLQDLI
ncbi:MAG: RNA polymerase sigma factor [Planctomycetota bacterium]|jgi:RNA polymerase sigma-70 factor (ECF subfamily)